MGTRYVWGQQTKIQQVSYQSYYVEASESTGTVYYDIARQETFLLGSGKRFQQDDGSFSLTNTTRYLNKSGASFGAGQLKSAYGFVHYCSNWMSGPWTNPDSVYGNNTTKYYAEGPYQKEQYYYVQGSFINYISNKNQSQYPSNNESGSYWYVLQGSDSIDAKAVILPEIINDGSTIQIIITPSDQKKYSGTVSYQYQYKFDDNDWTNLGSITTLATQNIEVPIGVTSIQIRVKAQDDLGFISDTWVESEAQEVIVNQKPTTPGPIIVDNVYINQHLYVTISESIDPDGEVIGYTIERSIDGGAFTPVSSNTQDLVFSEIVNPEWGTVAYRAYSTDNEGLNSDYAISETIDVNPGWVIISGPQNDLGERAGPFNLDLMFDVSGVPDEEGIHVKCVMDNRYNIFDFSLNTKEIVRIYLNTKYLATGEHKLEILADKEEYMSVTANYTFKVPNIDIDLMANAIAEIPQNPEGRPIAWIGLAQCIYGPDGRDVIQMAGDGLKLSQGNYIGTGTSGQSAKNTIVTGFKAKIITLYKIDNSSSIVINMPASNTGTIQGITFESTDTEFSWYAGSANEQFNEEGVEYGYFILG